MKLLQLGVKSKYSALQTKGRCSEHFSDFKSIRNNFSTGYHYEIRPECPYKIHSCPRQRIEGWLFQHFLVVQQPT